MKHDDETEGVLLPPPQQITVTLEFTGRVDVDALLKQSSMNTSSFIRINDQPIGFAYIAWEVR